VYLARLKAFSENLTPSLAEESRLQELFEELCKIKRLIAGSVEEI
jgi:hypothetical protein